MTKLIFALFIVMVLVAVNQVDALNCYVCADSKECAAKQEGDGTACADGEDTCVMVLKDASVERKCAAAAACTGAGMLCCDADKCNVAWIQLEACKECEKCDDNGGDGEGEGNGSVTVTYGVVTFLSLLYTVITLRN